MRKLLLLAAAVASLSFTNPEVPMAARIGIDPKPPSVGDSVTLSAGANMELRIEVDPNGVFTVRTGADGKATFVVPAGAAAMIVSESSGAWTANSTTVNP